MFLITLYISAFLLLGSNASPAPQVTTSRTEQPTSTSCAAPITSPTAPYSVLSTRSGSPIHLRSMQARGGNFYLGGSPTTYCPQPPVPNCPSGLATIFSGLGSLVSFNVLRCFPEISNPLQSVPVPSSQLIYVRRDGSLGFTRAHSASYPEGAILGGDLTYSKTEDARFGRLGSRAFDAQGFVACPTKDQGYQVFAANSSATAPGGALASCLGFSALTVDAVDPSRGAWQYI